VLLTFVLRVVFSFDSELIRDRTRSSRGHEWRNAKCTRLDYCNCCNSRNAVVSSCA